VVFDYSDPPAAMTPERRAAHLERASRVAALGEPWISYFSPKTLAADLRGLGFRAIEDLGPREIAIRYFGAPKIIPRGPGGHVIRAGTIGRAKPVHRGRPALS
jgi:O-methyltransferase involved in polyketide biosynthesis